MGDYCGYHVNKLFVAWEKRGFSMIPSLYVGRVSPQGLQELTHSLGRGILELTEGQPLNNDSLQK